MSSFLSKDISLIRPGLYLSACEPAWSNEILEEREIKRVISLICHLPKRYLWTRGNRGKAHSPPYYFHYTRDGPKFPIQNHFIRCMRWLSQPGNTLVHCRAGMSRSATIVILWMMQYYDWNVDTAIHIVRQQRLVCPNVGFMQTLRNFEGIAQQLVAIWPALPVQAVYKIVTSAL